MGESRDRHLRKSRGASRDVIDAKVKTERSTPAGQHGQVVFPGAEQVREAILEGRCPFCGRGPFVLLARHTHAKHGIDTYELRDLAGLTYTESILAADHHEKRSLIAKELHAAGILKSGAGHGQYTKPQRVSEAGREIQRRTPQRLRVARGSCPICGGQIPDSAHTNHRTCGKPECVHEAISSARRAMKRPRQPCAVCGGALPEHAQARAKTCSKRCAGILSARTSPRGRLTGEQVAEIRSLRAQGVPRREVARLFGIEPDTVSDITGGKRHPMNSDLSSTGTAQS